MSKVAFPLPKPLFPITFISKSSTHTSGLYKDENYSGHWSWIYFFNNEAQCDECGVKSFDWIAQQLKTSEVPVTDNKKAENNPSQAVKTGDTAHGEIYAMIMMFAAAGYVFFKQRKEA